MQDELAHAPYVGKECKVKRPEGKKSSLKSAALVVQQQQPQKQETW